MKPIRVDVPTDKHNKLKAMLALEGTSISKWIRDMIKQKLEVK